MCGRYWIDPEFDGGLEMPEGVKTSGEILPGDTAEVICRSRAGNIRSFAMEWSWTLDNGKKLINARSETAHQKSMFSVSMTHRRCLLPMSAYFEWEKRGRDKIKYRIEPSEPGISYLAGIYRFENKGPVFLILTKEAEEQIRFIHDRMPVIIRKDDMDKWLNGNDGLVIPKCPMTYSAVI